MDALVLSPDLFEAMVEHARSAVPDEACGLFAGLNGRATVFYPGRNVSPTPRVAYELDVETLARQIEIEDQGLELVAIYHSHPRGPAIPSGTDVALAYYPQALYVICAFDGPNEPSVRAFSIRDGRVTEVEILSGRAGDLNGTAGEQLRPISQQMD